jgi:glutamate synthase (NADPH/NADH) small chain
MYGIPNFKLEKSVVLRRIGQYEASGIVFHQGVNVGNDVTIAELRSRHDAVLIATGVYKARELDVPHNHQPNIHQALEFLIQSNRQGLGDAVDANALNAKDKHVVVVGGGDTAMDCVRTAIRQQAKSVTCLYRRDRENMPGSAREVKNAEEEGVVFEWLSAPAQFHGRERVEALDVQAMRLGAADASGRRLPTPIAGSIRQIPADMVIAALGFEPEDLPVLFNTPELRLTTRGTLAVDKRMMTSVEGIFAAGDIVRGASLVVWAIADGRDVAERMMEYMEQHTCHPERSEGSVPAG